MSLIISLIISNLYFTAWFALIGFTFSSLLTLIVLMYRGSSAALFQEHSAIMLGLIIDVVTFAEALVAWVLAISNRNSHLFLKRVCLILGDLACDLLLFILDPILGWIIFGLGASILVYLLYVSDKQIFKYCREYLETVSNWFEQKFQQSFKLVEKFDLVESTKSWKFNGKLCTVDVQIVWNCKKNWIR